MVTPAVKAASPVALIAAIIVAILGSRTGSVQPGEIAQWIAAVLAGLVGAVHAPTAKHAAKKVARKIPSRRHAGRPAPRPVTRPPSRPAGPRFGLDWAWGAMPVKALKTVGATFACRYLSFDESKNLSPRESETLRRAGIDRVVVWETTAARATDGQDAGIADASRALEQARACGLPRQGTWAIYFAIDFDASGPDVDGYFRGVHSVLGAHAGAYGGARPLAYLLDRGLIHYAWQTYAWSRGRWEPRAQLLQFSNGHTVSGVDVDFDRAVKPDFGQW